MTRNLANYEVLLAVTGGIGAYKAAALCSQLVKLGAGVTVVMTAHAQRFVGPLTFSTLSGRQVYTEMFSDEQVYNLRHIALTDRADLIVVAPATANIIAKAAAGICDDLVSTLLCSGDSEILFAPAMNERMWTHPATCRNVETLREWGCHFVGPERGRLACQVEGVGRMSEPEDILARVVELLADKTAKQMGTGDSEQNSGK